MTKVQRAAKFAMENVPMKYYPGIAIRKTSQMTAGEIDYIRVCLALGHDQHLDAEWYAQIHLTVGHTEVNTIGSGASAVNAVRTAFGLALSNHATLPKTYKAILALANEFETGMELLTK